MPEWRSLPEMIDLRPVGYVIGILVALLGAAMVFPLLVDLAEGRLPVLEHDRHLRGGVCRNWIL